MITHMEHETPFINMNFLEIVKKSRMECTKRLQYTREEIFEILIEKETNQAWPTTNQSKSISQSEEPSDGRSNISDVLIHS